MASVTNSDIMRQLQAMAGAMATKQDMEELKSLVTAQDTVSNGDIMAQLKAMSDVMATKKDVEELKNLAKQMKIKGQTKSGLVYPQIRRDESSFDDFHGKKIANPYHWLEDPDSEETKAFVKAQNELTDPIIKSCEVRDSFKKRLTELWDYPKFGCPFRRGNRYFYYHNSGLQNQSVLYVQSSLNGKAEVFLDPNSMCDKGLLSLRGMAFSEDGEYCAYGISGKGSDWVTIKFMKVATKEVFEGEELHRVKFSCMDWTHDNKGLFYNKYPEDESKQDGTETNTNLHQKLYYHRLGTKQSEDVLVAEFPDHPKWMCGAELSNDGRYVMLMIREGCEPVNRMYVCDLEKIGYKINGLLPYDKIVDNFDAEYDFIANEGDKFVFKTNKDAPRYKLISIAINNYNPANWKTLVDEHEKDVLEWSAAVNNDTLVLCYLHDVKNKLYLHHLKDGRRYKELELDIGTIIGYSGRKEHTEMFYSFDSFLMPSTIYHVDFKQTNLTPKIFRKTEVKGFDSSLFEAHQVFYKSKDGTKVPMFIVHRKGIVLDGSHPCFLYGYGGFNISITPAFSITRVIFMQNLGGIYAIANIRGGGEYGQAWHKSGCFEKRQNCYDDFQSAAEYLIDNKYTNSERLTINGGSNGGLLVSTCMNQRPELYKCVVAQVAVCDMLKFHKYTIGHAWTTDFGCSDNKEGFDYLYKYSPIHNVRVSAKSQYPAVLLMTADHDDRVVPLHSYKLISELQHRIAPDQKQKNPLLIKIDTESGHGAGKPTAKRIEESSDMYAFIAKMVGASWRD